MKQELHPRKSPRLKDYDYTQNGTYFVTIVTQLRQYHFGKVINQGMVLSAIGQIAEVKLKAVPVHWSGLVEVDCFIVMPNHVHAIILLTDQATEVNHQALDTQKRVPTLGRVVHPASQRPCTR